MSSRTALSRSSEFARGRPSVEEAEIERDDGSVAQALRHVAGHDALRQALHDRGLAAMPISTGLFLVRRTAPAPRGGSRCHDP